jgi:hypothetical protein
MRSDANSGISEWSCTPLGGLMSVPVLIVTLDHREYAKTRDRDKAQDR